MKAIHRVMDGELGNLHTHLQGQIKLTINLNDYISVHFCPILTSGMIFEYLILKTKGNLGTITIT